MPTPEDVYTSLREVYDPEIPVNIVDLGLVYDVQLDGGACKVTMTLTSESCPEAKRIPAEVERRVTSMEGVESTSVEIVWEPKWTPHRITAAGREILGIEAPEA